MTMTVEDERSLGESTSNFEQDDVPRQRAERVLGEVVTRNVKSNWDNYQVQNSDIDPDTGAVLGYN